MNKKVDLFIQEKVSKEYRSIVTEFRNLIKNDFPQLKEEMRGGTEKYYGVPVYRNNKIILTVSPTKKGITFSFAEGKRIDDKYSLLEGEGNKTLNLRISNIEDFNKDIFKYYITQAIKIDNV